MVRVYGAVFFAAVARSGSGRLAGQMTGWSVHDVVSHINEISPGQSEAVRVVVENAIDGKTFVRLDGGQDLKSDWPLGHADIGSALDPVEAGNCTDATRLCTEQCTRNPDLCRAAWYRQRCCHSCRSLTAPKTLIEDFFERASASIKVCNRSDVLGRWACYESTPDGRSRSCYRSHVLGAARGGGMYGYSARSCDVAPVTNFKLGSCLGGKTIAFIGSSRTRYLYGGTC